VRLNEIIGLEVYVHVQVSAQVHAIMSGRSGVVMRSR